MSCHAAATPRSRFASLSPIAPAPVYPFVPWFVVRWPVRRTSPTVESFLFVPFTLFASFYLPRLPSPPCLPIFLLLRELSLVFFFSVSLQCRSLSFIALSLAPCSSCSVSLARTSTSLSLPLSLSLSLSFVRLSHRHSRFPALSKINTSQRGLKTCVNMVLHCLYVHITLTARLLPPTRKPAGHFTTPSPCLLFVLRHHPPHPPPPTPYPRAR